MSPPSLLSCRALAALVLVTGFTVALRADDPQKTREQEIAEVQKQIEALQKRLDELAKKKAAPAAKKTLSLADADTWRSVRGVALAPDGKWFAHRVGAAEGEADLFLRNLSDGRETKFPGGSGFGTTAFSLDSKWFAFTYSPPAKGGSKGGKAKVVLVNLANGEKTEIEGASSVRFNGEAATHAAFRKVPDAAGGPSGSPSSSGSDLVLRDLATGTDLVLGNVSEFAFTKKGDWLVTIIDASGQLGNGVHLREMRTGLVYPIESGKAKYRSISWDDATAAFAVTKETEGTGADSKSVAVVGFTDLGPKPKKTVYDPKGDKSFPADMVITGAAEWTDALDGFTFSITKRKPKTETAPAPKEVKTDPKDGAKKGKTALATNGSPPSAGGKPDLVVWHWKDERLQPMQEKQAGGDRVKSYPAVYWTKDKKFVRLADETFKQVGLAPKQKFAIGRDSKPYEYMSYLNGKLFTDVYVVDPKTGTRTKAVEKLSSLFFGPASVTPSPTGTHALYYKDGHYHVLDLAAAKSVNVTEKVGASFVNAEDDHNFDKPAQPNYGWSRDGKFVLLSDGWDIWKVSADGTGGASLTVNGKSD